MYAGGRKEPQLIRSKKAEAQMLFFRLWLSLHDMVLKMNEKIGEKIFDIKRFFNSWTQQKKYEELVV